MHISAEKKCLYDYTIIVILNVTHSVAITLSKFDKLKCTYFRFSYYSFALPMNVACMKLYDKTFPKEIKS